MKHYRIIIIFVSLLAALGMKAQSPLALTIEDFTIKAGETKTVNIPAGIYVVNGVKIIVK